MSRIRISMALPLVILAAMPGAAQSIPTAFRWDSVIFVAEIERADVQRGCGPVRIGCPVDVDAKAVEILKDSAGLGLLPGTFWATVPQRSVAGSDRVGWAGMAGNGIRAGQRYLVFANGHGGLPSLFESPSSVTLVTDGADTVADVRLMLASTALPLRQQAEAATAALSDGGRPRGSYLADYAATILTAGSETDTAALAHALEYAAPSSLSDLARTTLLGELWRQVRGGHAPESRMHLFVALTARYLAITADESTSPPPSLSVPGLLWYVSWILDSEAARAQLHGAVPQDVADRLVRLAAGPSSGNALTADQTAQLQKFVSAVAGR